MPISADLAAALAMAAPAGPTASRPVVVSGRQAEDAWHQALAGLARQALDHYGTVTYPRELLGQPGDGPLRAGQVSAALLDGWAQDDSLDLDEDLDPGALRDHQRRAGRVSALKLAAGLDQAAMAALAGYLKAPRDRAATVFLDALVKARGWAMRLQDALDATATDADYSRGQMERLILEAAPDPAQEDPIGLYERLDLDIRHQIAVGEQLLAAKDRYRTQLAPLLKLLDPERPQSRDEDARTPPAGRKAQPDRGEVPPEGPAADPVKSRREALRRKIRARRNR